jgi:hypothetical protein
MLAFLLFACASPEPSVPKEVVVPPTPPPPPKPAVPATCTIDGIEGAHPVGGVSLPTTCSFSASGSPSAPLRVDDPTKAVSCEAGTAAVMDLGGQDLVVVRYEISPASTGLEVYDDGTTVTFATRFRQPCPNDPHPMPMQQIFGFMLPKGEARTWREANCTLPLDCP